MASIDLSEINSIPKDDRTVVMIPMGEYQVKKLKQFHLATTDLSTCFALCLYNPITRMGGLYHIPCFPILDEELLKQLDDENKKASHMILYVVSY